MPSGDVLLLALGSATLGKWKAWVLLLVVLLLLLLLLSSLPNAVPLLWAPLLRIMLPPLVLTVPLLLLLLLRLLLPAVGVASHAELCSSAAMLSAASDACRFCWCCWPGPCSAGVVQMHLVRRHELCAACA